MTDYRFTPRELSNPHLQKWRATWWPHRETERLPLRAERRAIVRRWRKAQV